MYTDIKISSSKQVVEEHPLTDPRAPIPLDGTYADVHGLSEVEHELNLV